MLKQALANNIAELVSVKLASGDVYNKLASGDFYESMLARGDRFYSKALPVQEKIISQAATKPNAKAMLGRAGLGAMLAGAGGLYLASKLKNIENLIKKPGE